MNSTTQYHESSVTHSYPWGGLVRADGALCPDGVRRVAYPSGDGFADTFFSLPARVRITRDGSRFTVSGYVTMETMDGFSTHTDDDPLTVKFYPYLCRKNGALLADTDDLIRYVRECKSHDGTHRYVHEAETELERRGVVLVPIAHAPHGHAIFRTTGNDAGTLARDEKGNYA